MPETSSLVLSMDSTQVNEGKKALDGFGDAAESAERKATSASKALDGVSESGAKVWRFGADAAKSVDALGEATQRTGQRTQVNNGQMADTARLLQAQQQAARDTAAANVALGVTTDRLTVGQQMFIERLQEQVAVLGMSRSQLAAYQAAQLGVSTQAQQSIAALKAYEDQVKAAAEAKAAATAKANQLTDALKLLAAGYSVLKLGEYIKDASLLAARYETLGIVAQVVGKNAGYTATQMDFATDAIARQGITMTESRQSAIKLVQAHVDLSNATGLARIAQDAAVIGNINSSEAFDRLVNGIARGNTLILRNIGINVNLQSAYQQMATELGKSTKELTENERVQARLSAVMARGTDIAGTYEAAMGTASKQIASMQRYTEDLKTVFGEVFNELLTVSVMGLTAGLKDANGEMKELSADGTLKEWGRDLTSILVGVVNSISNIITMTKLAAVEAAHATGASGSGGLGYAAPDANPLAKMGAQLFGAMGFDSSAPTAASEKVYQDMIGQLSGDLDKFARAQDERRATVLAKDKAAAEAKLKVETEYLEKAKAVQTAYAGYSLEIQRAAQAELAKSVYVGTPTYRDTEGREPKAKVDRAESTELADYIKQQEAIATAAKVNYSNLSKLDDMYHKAGELSDQQFYENKRTYADKTMAAQIGSFDKELAALVGHDNATEAEEAKTQKQIDEIWDKRKAALAQGAAESKLQDETERLRKDAIVKASVDASLKEIASINAQVAAVEMQIRTYNMLPAAKTAVMIADLEEQKTALGGFAGAEKSVQLIDDKIEALGRLKAAQAIATAQDTGSDVAKAKELLDILTAVDSATKSAAASMTDSFGRVGTAIGGLTTALSGYAVQQQAIAAQLASTKADPKSSAEKIARAETDAAHASAQAQIKSYGDMAGAAKSFFKENSTGYKVLETTEKAYRAVEMAMAIENMVVKSGLVTGFTGLFVASKATETAVDTTATGASVVNSGIRATADGIAAFAKTLASVPFPYNIAAGVAVVAALAAMGVAISGGGGSGGGQSAADVQKAQGTGSVFGDSSAKSDSIRHSIELLQKNSSDMLPINQGMLTALQSIEASMSGLTNLVVRTTGLTDGTNMGIQEGTIGKSTGASIASGAAAGAIAGSYFGPIGTAIGAIGGAIIGGLKSIWGKTTQNIVDSGLQYGGGVRGLEGGQGFNQYASVDTTTSSWFGLSKSTNNSVQMQGLTAELSAQFGLIFTGLDKSLQAAATAMGGSADDVSKVLDSLTLESTKVSLKGLTGTALTDALNSVISKSMDEIAQAAFPAFDQFRQVGEGYAETVMRVAGDYAKLDSILAASSTTFGATGVASIAAREHLIELTGGIDQLSSQTSFFTQNFLTKAQQLAPVQKYVTEQLAAMGEAGITTRDQFAAAVTGLANSGALATEAGAQQYAALLALAPAFAQTHAATVDLTKSEQEIADERKDLQTQLDELTMTQVQLADKARAAIDPLNQALYDQVQAAQAAKDAIADANSVLDIQGQIYAATGNAAGAAAVLEQQHAAALLAMTPALAAANTALWAAQAAATAQAKATTESNSILAAQAATYVANGNTAAAAAVLLQQHTIALAAMTPAVAAATQAQWDAEAAATLQTKAISEYGNILTQQAAMYAATGDKAGAAAVLEQQHAVALVGLSPALIAATTATWAAQAAEKARTDALTISNGNLTNMASYYEAINDKVGAANTAALQWTATLAAMDPVLRDSATLAHDAQLATKASNDAQAEMNSVLSLQAQYYSDTTDEASAAIIAEQQHREAMKGLTGDTALWTEMVYQSGIAAKAAAKAQGDTNTLLGLQAQTYASLKNETAAATIASLQHAEAMKGLTGDIAAWTETAYQADLTAKAMAKAQADTNSMLALQATYFADVKDAGAQAAVAEAIHLQAMKDLTGVVAEWTQKVYDADKALKASTALKDAQTGFDSAVSSASGALQTAAGQYQAFIDTVVSAQKAVVDAHKAIRDEYDKALKADTDAKAAVLAEQDKITAGYITASDAVAAARLKMSDALYKAGDDIVTFIKSLDTTDLGGGSIFDQAAALKDQFASTLAQFNGGDAAAGAALPAIAKSLIEASSKTSGDALEQAKMVAYIKTSLGDASAASMAKGTKPADAADDLTTAIKEQKRWADAVAASGASMTKSADDLLKGYRDAVTAQQTTGVALQYWAQVAGGTDTSLLDTKSALATTGDALIKGFFDAQAAAAAAQANLDAANEIRNGMDLRQTTALESFVVAIKAVNTSAKDVMTAAGVLFTAAGDKLVAGTEAAATAQAAATAGMTYWGQVVTTTAAGIAASVQAMATAAAAIAAAQATSSAATGAASGAASANENMVRGWYAGSAAYQSNGTQVTNTEVDYWLRALQGNSAATVKAQFDASATSDAANAALVKSWYANNSQFQAKGTVTADGIAYWVNALKSEDVTTAKTQFATAVARDGGFAKALDISAFVNGGDHMGGLRLVGEDGPELESTGPSRIFNAGQTRDILRGAGGGDNTALLTKIDQLTAVVAKQQAALDSMAKTSMRSKDILEGVAAGSIVLQTEEA